MVWQEHDHFLWFQLYTIFSNQDTELNQNAEFWTIKIHFHAWKALIAGLSLGVFKYCLVYKKWYMYGIFNLAKQGYCNHFVCLSVCLSVCFLCVRNQYIYTYYATHGILHGALWCYIMKHSCIFFWEKQGEVRWGGWGEVRWGRVGPNKPILPIFNHFEPHKTTFPHFTPTLPHFFPLIPTFLTFHHFSPLLAT